MKCNLDFWLQTDSLHDIDSTSMEAHDSREISIFFLRHATNECRTKTAHKHFPNGKKSENEPWSRPTFDI